MLNVEARDVAAKLPARLEFCIFMCMLGSIIWYRIIIYIYISI